MTNTLEKPIEIPTGFHFDKENHAYFLDGKPMHGVTSILRVIAKPALIQWAANMACDEIENYLKWHSEEKVPAETMIQNLFTHVIKSARTAHNKRKESAGVAGTDVHSQIEEIVKEAIENHGGNLNTMTAVLGSGYDNANPQVKKFIQWALDNNVKFLESEKQVYSKESWYAGTLDLVLEMNGEKWIADIKTSSAIYPEFYLQMAAYQNALEEMGEHEDIKGALVINLNKRGGFELGRNYDYEGNRLAFLGALILYKQLNALSPEPYKPTKKVITI